MTNPHLHLEQRVLGDIHTSRAAMDTLEVLCDDFGARWGGSEDERRAAEFLRDRLADYGCAGVRLEAFEYVGWTRGPATLQVTAPVERSLPCISLPMCPPASVAGPLVVVGDGAPGEFDALGERLRGAVAWVGTTPPRGLNRTVHRSEKYQRTALAGAAAFLYVSQYPGYGPETGSIANDREALIPGVSISYEHGELLRRLAHRHGTLAVQVETTDRSRLCTSWNVVGEIPGRASPEEWVIVGCHYDGHDIAQGAHDPASGAVAVVEAARVLVRHAAPLPGCGIRFVLFGVEETGLIGAYRYVAQHAAELDGIRFMLNMDAAGGPGRKGLSVNRWPALTPLLARWAEEMAAEVPVAQKTGAFSDHYPFFLQGVPTAMMGDPLAVSTGRGFDHTAFDTLDKVALSDLRDAAAMGARLAYRVSVEESWPARRRSVAAVEALIAAEPSLEGQEVRCRMEELYRARAGNGAS